MAYTRAFRYGRVQFQLQGDADDPYLRGITVGDQNSDFFINIVERFRGKRSTIFDVGANIGLTSVISSVNAQAVFSFEPSPSTYQHLRTNMAANGLENVSTFNVALGAAEGELSFFHDPNSGSASHLITDDTIGRSSETKVAVRTLDKVVKEHDLARLDLIKIDVEGFEIDVIKGARHSIASFKSSVFVEFNSFTMIGFRNINPRDFLSLLLDTFPYVYRWKDRPTLITGEPDALSFIHDNLVSAGCVDDLYCSFTPL